MAFRAFGKRLLKVLMLFTLCCLCFGYGLAARQYEIFPYSVLRAARTALMALIEVTRDASDAKVATHSPPLAGQISASAPVVMKHSDSMGDELLLVSGGAGYLTEHCDTGCLAWLMDRDGTVKHVWKYDPSLWNDLKSVSRVPLVSGDLYPVGLHVFDDGSLLATFQGENTFPFAIGMARFDANSNLVWKKEFFAHHWFSVADDGRIFVPALRIVEGQIPIDRTNASIKSQTGKIYSDVILVLDANGNVLDEISMLDALFASGWAGLVARPGSPGPGDVLAADPLHLNDVQLAGTQGAEAQSWLSPDDLLVSFASINTVGVLDPIERRFKWISAGTTIGQHSPRFYDGGVLAIDNLGGDKTLGGTQLVKIDLERGRPTVLFPKSGVETPGLCHTETSGHLDLSRDNKRVLMALANAATVWEIDIASGKVLWEYIYMDEEFNGYAKIHTAKYVESPSFLRNGKGL